MLKKDDHITQETDEAYSLDINDDTDEILKKTVGPVDPRDQFEAGITTAKADAITDTEAELEKLKAELAAAKADAAEWQDRFMRKAAEFENYRKRVDKEKAELRIHSQGAILRDVLHVLDGFDRALKYFGKTEAGAGSAEQYREGVELLYRQVLDTLAQSGVVPIEAKGKPFDPHLHEAISLEETSEAAEGTIVNEARRGYMFKDSLLRPSQVVVAAKPKDA